MRHVAPTLLEIIAAKATLCISCTACQTLYRLDAFDLATRRRQDRPVDQLVFRCRRCDGVGQPVVTGPGNMLIGHPKLWPPGGPSPPGSGE